MPRRIEKLKDRRKEKRDREILNRQILKLRKNLIPKASI